ncbi:MAG: VapE domain-containing protein [Cyanobacteriota bacterium]
MADLTPLYSAIAPVSGKPQTLQPGELAIELRNHLGDRLAFNMLTMAPELDGEAIPAHCLDELYIALSERGWKIEKGKAFDAVLKIARENSYHPVVQYLDHIAADDGIEPADLDSLASRYLGTTDPLYDEMMASTLVGAVARALEPGTKFDTCCVLRGPQGIMKSTFWRCLASPDWFCDTPQENEKDLKLAIHTCWIYELAELDATTGKKEAAQVKALLSSPVDQFRPPYGRTTEKHPRRSILVGTCNRDDFLRDETGSRRFWVIEVNGRPDICALRNGRDRILKAAVLAFRAGREPILSPASQAESERRNRGYAPEHPWLGLLARWVGTAPAEFTTDQALTGAGCVGDNRIERRHQNEVAPLLRSLGFERDRNQTRADGGERPRLWRRVPHPVSTSAEGVETAQTPGQNSHSALLSHPLKLNKENLVDKGKGADISKEFSKQVETLRQPSTKSTLPVIVDGEPGWFLPAPLSTHAGPSTRVVAVDPQGQSKLITKGMITLCELQRAAP